MWNLLADYAPSKEKPGTLVTIITHYYDSKRELACLIAVDQLGNFINSYVGNFVSHNKAGFLDSDFPCGT
jgi:hypothetical protein